MSTRVISHILNAQVLALYDQNGKLLSKFDLAASGMPERLTRELLRSMLSEFGHTSLETHRQTFRCVKKLITFLAETHETIELPLSETTPAEFHKWLAGSSICAATAQSHQNAVFTVLKWCQRNSPGVVSRRAGFCVPTFQRNQPKLRMPMSEESVRSILAACYKEIEEAEANREVGDRLLKGEIRDPREEALANLIEELLSVGKGRIPNQTVMGRAKNNLSRRVALSGGLSVIRDLIYVNPRVMFPFYLAVLCQTAGNPFPIAHIRRNCIESHPIRGDIEVLSWHKPRSNMEQRAEFPASKQWAAPSIVRKYLEISKHAREQLAEGYHKEYLFIASPRRGPPEAKVPCAQLMHLMLDDFILKHGIENFDFKDLRLYSAQAHRKTSGGILASKHKLNHRSVATTARYLNPTEPIPQYDKFVHKFQGKLISLTKGVQDTKPYLESQANKGNKSAFSTVFGFDCANPLAGIAGHSRKGSLCADFTGCATCPGAVIPVDDPIIISRLISAKQALNSAKARSIKEGWASRFNQIYLPTLTILEIDILPSVSKAVLAKAALLVSSHSIPHLE